MELSEKRKQHIEYIVNEVYQKSCNEYSFEDFAREYKIHRIKESDFGDLTYEFSSVSLNINGEYAIIINDKLKTEERKEIMGHELGHILLGHVKQMNVNADMPVKSGMIEPDTPEEFTEANYFKQLWCDRFSNSGWINYEKIKDLKIVPIS